MNKGQTVYKDCHVIPIIVISVVIHILIDNLQFIIMNIRLINQRDILRKAGISFQNLNVIFLNFACLFYNAFIFICNTIRKETLPFFIGEYIIIQFFQLLAKILYQILLVMDCKIFITLFLQKSYKLTL